jgi:protein-tyrosine phosphatase
MATLDSGRDGAARRIDPTFEIVLICTGNRFRSPIAEGLLRDLGGGLPLELRSYGTLDVGPAPPLMEAFEVAARYGLDLSGHRARPLAGEDLGGADLVLGFELAHLSASVVDAGADRERSFLLPELVELFPAVPRPEHFGTVAAAREIVWHAAELRSLQPERTPSQELRDPLGGPPQGFLESAVRIENLCRNLLQGLFGRGRAATPTEPRVGERSRRRR